ncbi:hypothetical protein LQW54_001499 [Pestalotiopsis sp. IQ-011]
MAQAICALHSQARWAVTGTPVQNRLGDLASLLKFIRAHPYTEPKHFDADISQLWKSGKDEEAVKRLKRLASCMLLRRAKTTIELPPRTDLECPVHFDSEEKEAYSRLHQQAIVKIDEVLQSTHGASKSNTFVNVLQQIEALRLFCSLGLRYHTRHEANDTSNNQDGNWNKVAQSVFNTQRQMGSVTCLQCASNLDLTESLFEDGNQSRQEARFFKCLKRKMSVREVQKSKQALANVLLSSHGDGQADTSLSVLEKFDESLLSSLASRSSTQASAKTVVVKAPRLYLFDRETNTQVLEDFTNAGGFKSIVFSPDADSLVPQPPVIGRHLGSWLRSFHDWSSAPQQSAIREQLWQKNPFRKLKYLVTFDVFLGVLEKFPELLDGHQKTLKEVQEAKAAEFQKPSTEADDGWGLIHGDLWSGNILLSNPPWNEPPQLGIIDWEFAQFGHRSYDLGQIVGDLYEKAVFLNADTKSVMEAIIAGYGDLSDDMAFRTAIYVGVHLIGWYHRRPRSAPPVAQEVVAAGLSIGRDFICKGWEKDRKFFGSTALASLFTPK